MKIRTQLLLAMAGLLVLATGLSLVLHHREGERVRAGFETAVREIVHALVEAHEPDGPLAATEPRLDDGSDHLVPHLVLGPERWSVTIEKRHLELDEPVDARVIPPAAFEATLLDGFLDPIHAARRESLPRELAIAGAVLVVGLGVLGVVASRLARPLRDLTERMERVAAGDFGPSADGSSVGAVAATARRRDEIGKIERAFRSMVARLRESRELERQMHRAERLSAVGALAAGVAHDIRNPLHAIGLTLAHVRESHRPTDAEAARRFCDHLDDARRELDRLERLVRDFLALAREEGEGTGDRASGAPGCDAPGGLAEIVEETARLFRKEAEARGARLRVESAEVGLVAPLARSFRGALANVLVNALEAVKDAAHGEIVLGLSREGDEAVVSVTDDGVGIAEADLDRVTLPYFTTRPEGTGLGLALAASALAAQGGRLEIRSRPGEGTRVELRLAARGEPFAAIGGGAR